MNVSELYSLTLWIEDKVVSVQIPQKYQALQQALQRNVQPNQQKQPFETQRDDLISTIKKVPLNQLTREQLLFLERLGIGKSVGKNGVVEINDILYKNSLDIATAAQKIQEIHTELNKGIQKAKQIQTGLAECVDLEEYEEADEVMIRVTFTGQASMNNVVDFKKWGNTWHEIGRGISMAHNAHPEDIKVIGATKGSVIIELATNPAIATTASAIIFFALKLAEKVLDIKKKAEELKSLKLKNKKLVKDLEKEAENEKKEGIEEICNKLILELKIDSNGDGEKVNALNKAVKDLIDFIEYGGEVDFIVPDEDSEEPEEKGEQGKPEYEKLRSTIQEIRQLENKLKLLESKLDKDNEE